MWLTPSSGSARAVAITLLLAHLSTAISGGSDKLNAYLAAHPVSTITAVPSAISSSNNTISRETVNLVLSECPASCDESGSQPGNWTLYPRLGRLLMCNQTMLLDFNLYNSLRTEETIRACTSGFIAFEGAGGVGNSTTISGSHTTIISTGNTTLSASNTTINSGSCMPSGNLTQIQQPLQLAFNETSTAATLEDFEHASQQLAVALAQRDSNCTETTSFTYSNSVALGLFAGSGVQGIPASVLEQFRAKIKSTGFSKSAVVQLCAKGARSSKYSFGIAVSGDRDLSFVQDAVATWASGQCITTYDTVEPWQEITLSVPHLLSNGTITNGTTGNGTVYFGTPSPANSTILHRLFRRTLCTTIQVVSGDSCKSLQQSHSLHIC
jgi:chitinase